MKIKKLLSVFILLVCIIVLSSCNKKTPTLMDYSDVYAEITLEEQKDIEEAYYKKYNNNINWCMPNRNKKIFKNSEDLREYSKSNLGIRVYAKVDDYILLFQYATTGFGITSELYYNDTIVLSSDDSVFATSFSYIYLYKNGNIYEIRDFTDDIFQRNNIANVLNLTENNIQAIKNANDKYNEVFFLKFLNSEEKQNKDYKKAFNRLKNELYYKEHPVTNPKTTKEPVDTTYRPTEVIK